MDCKLNTKVAADCDGTYLGIDFCFSAFTNEVSSNDTDVKYIVPNTAFENLAFNLIGKEILEPGSSFAASLTSRFSTEKSLLPSILTL